MTHHRIAALLAAAMLSLPAAPAHAQTADQPAAPSAAAPKAAPAKKAHKHAAAKAPARPAAAAAAPSIVPSPLGADGDASLERRRRAFFAKPDDIGVNSESGAPVGVTLGGSNGLTPGMGMKF